MMSVQLAVDFGTTNTVVAGVESGNVRILTLPELGRQQPLEQLQLVPTAVHAVDAVRPWLFFKRRIRQVQIGQQALNQMYGSAAAHHGAFARSFKPLLGGQSHIPAGLSGISAREATVLFLAELLAAVRKQGIKPTDLTIPTPVGFFEPFRDELQSIAKQLKIRHFHTIDEQEHWHLSGPTDPEIPWETMRKETLRTGGSVVRLR